MREREKSTRTGEVIRAGGCTPENSGKSPAKPKQGRPRTEFTHRQYQLSQNDQWENNGVLDDILNLLPRLIDFGRRRETVSVIVTSIFNPPDEVAEFLVYASYQQARESKDGIEFILATKNNVQMILLLRPFLVPIED